MTKKIAFVFVILFLTSQTTWSKTERFTETLCEDPDFYCIEASKGDSWETLWPDETQRNAMRRLNRTNFKLRAGMKIVLPKDPENFELLKASGLPEKLEENTEKTVLVDLAKLAWGAYDQDGTLINWGPISGGRDFCPDIRSSCKTPVGEFRVYRKGGKSCKSRTFPIPKGGAPMAYCMFFKAGWALHASSEVPGYHASHGCVRLLIEDAKWLNETFVELPNTEADLEGTRVLIYPYAEK